MSVTAVARRQTLSGVAPAPLGLTDIDAIRAARRSLASWHVALGVGRKTVLRAMYVLDLLPTAPLTVVESFDEEEYFINLKHAASDYVGYWSQT